MIPGPRYIEDPETLVAGNAVRLLRNGREAFPAWLAAIEAARTRVSLEMYIFSDDTIGRRFAAALLAAAVRGVAVRLLYDFVGCRDTPASASSHSSEMLRPPVKATRPSHTRTLRWLRRHSFQKRVLPKRGR